VSWNRSSFWKDVLTMDITRRMLLKSSLLGGGAVVASSLSRELITQAAFGQLPSSRSNASILIKAALNGRRTRTEHPAVPISPEEVALSAKESVASGAGAIHVHVRSADGGQSIEPDDVAKAMTAVRAAVPGTPVGVSTNSSIQPDPGIRHQTVARWTVLPDFASVNIREEGAVALAQLLLSRGVGVEAGLNNAEQVELLVSSGLAPNCLRMLLEPGGQSTEASLRTAKEIESALDRAGVTVRRLLHGSNRTAWDLIDAAAARGYDTRVGFEDILTLPDGTMAAGNGVLVSEAIRRVRGAASRAAIAG
jgi:uncharacterized protein (DUF849 family)